MVRDSMDLVDESTLIRRQVFPGECPTKTALADGSAAGAEFVDILDHSMVDVELPIDGLSAAPHCFTATLVDASCRVLAFGATPADLTHHTHITTALNELVDPPRGGCVNAGEVCQDAFCQTP
jgi:hypothetical protein